MFSPSLIRLTNNLKEKLESVGFAEISGSGGQEYTRGDCSVNIYHYDTNPGLTIVVYIFVKNALVTSIEYSNESYRDFQFLVQLAGIFKDTQGIFEGPPDRRQRTHGSLMLFDGSFIFMDRLMELLSNK